MRHRQSKRPSLLSITHKLRSDHAAAVAMIVTRIVPVTISMTVPGPDEFYDVSGYFLPKKVAASRFIEPPTSSPSPALPKESRGAYGSHVGGNSLHCGLHQRHPGADPRWSEGLLFPPSDFRCTGRGNCAPQGRCCVTRVVGQSRQGRIRKAYNLDNSADHLAGVFRRRQGTD